ncbi:MAG: hypothetical protein KGO47_07340 [Cyanobacteria bacterium REEB417]|nr:hypothetical protein [Cyanobacteria bacterium REEB417]
MAASQAPNPPSFWAPVTQQFIAGLLLLGVGGITAGVIYIGYTVPTLLREIIANQAATEKRMNQFDGRLNNVEGQVKKLDNRVSGVEVRP